MRDHVNLSGGVVYGPNGSLVQPGAFIHSIPSRPIPVADPVAGDAPDDETPEADAADGEPDAPEASGRKQPKPKRKPPSKE